MRWGSNGNDTDDKGEAGRGRPKGAKDSKARQYRSRMAAVEVSGAANGRRESPGIEVPRQTIDLLCDLRTERESVLRKKIDQGKIVAFVRSRMLFVEPKAFLEYWLGGMNGRKHVVDSGMKEFLRTGK